MPPELIDEQQKQAEDALREDLLHQLDIALAEIVAQIAQLAARSGSAEQPELTQDLQTKLSQLEGQRGTIVSSGGAQLVAMIVTLPQTVGAVLTQIAQITERAVLDITHQTLEMTQEELAVHFTELRAANDDYQNRFWDYEDATRAEIAELAAQNGVDLAAFDKRQAEIERQREIARANGDRLELYRLDVMSAANLKDGLDGAGADTECLAEAQAQLDATRKRYMQEREMAAIEQGRGQGLTDQALVDFVAKDQQAAGAALDRDVEAGVAEGLTTEPQLANAALSTALREDRQADAFHVAERLDRQQTHLPPDVTGEVASMDLAGITLNTEEAALNAALPRSEVTSSRSQSSRQI
ncbi:MAG: hypothetical protein AAGH90_11980 [Pseudomonadota bacterium]